MTSFGFIGPMSAMLVLDLLVVVGSGPGPDAATQPKPGTTSSQEDGNPQSWNVVLQERKVMLLSTTLPSLKSRDTAPRTTRTCSDAVECFGGSAGKKSGTDWSS